MERERQHEYHNPSSGSGPTSDPERDARRERLRGLSERADRMIDSIEAGNAEKFLQQHRQRGARVTPAARPRIQTTRLSLPESETGGDHVQR